jgi:hypothetical protein
MAVVDAAHCARFEATRIAGGTYLPPVALLQYILLGSISEISRARGTTLRVFLVITLENLALNWYRT